MSETRKPDAERPDAPAKIIALARAVRAAGGRALLVGGCVRDFLLGRAAKDWDAEVYGVEPATLRELLARFGRVNTVGEAFTVYKIGRDIDVSLPRRERKQGSGHRGFVIEGDPAMTIEDAARRRDFTINAILQDPLTSEILDPFDGQKDLRDRVLRHVAAETFIEDSLRVLRAAQFAARFRFTIHPATLALCRRTRLDDLPAERIWGELEKLLLQAPQPSTGFRLLAETNATAQLFPELAALDTHTTAHALRTLDHARTLIDDLPHPKQIAVMLAALCHAFGEPARDGTGAATNDDVARRVELTQRFLERLKIHTLQSYDARAQTLALVGEYKRVFEFYERRERVTDGDFRRLARLCELALLYRVARACALAASEAGAERAPEQKVEAAAWFIARAEALNVTERPPAPLLMGRHLLEMGLQPSPRIGEIVAAVYEMQLDGQVRDAEEAKRAARAIIEEKPHA